MTDRNDDELLADLLRRLISYSTGMGGELTIDRHSQEGQAFMHLSATTPVDTDELCAVNAVLDDPFWQHG
jgi:hypothetical protein